MDRMLAATVSAVLFLLDVPSGHGATDRDVRMRAGALATPFVANVGQWDARAAFGATLFAGTVFVTTDAALVYRLNGTRPNRQDRASAARARGTDWVLTERFVGQDDARTPARPRGADPQPGATTFALGSKPTTVLGTFGSVELGRVLPGVDVALRATGRNVEKIFTVAAHEDPARIRVRVDGASALSLDPDGNLIATTGNGPVTYSAPVAFQARADGGRRDVEVRYAIDAEQRTYRFEVGAYDRNLPLVIDPLVRATYEGGGGNADAATGLAIHPGSGDVYVAGSTNSTDFPGTTGGAVGSNPGGTRGFVSRFSADLSTRIQATYFGGSLNGTSDHVWAIAIHPRNGDIYIAGDTTSGDLPSHADGAQNAPIAGTEAFVARLDPTLQSVVRTTYLGGSGSDIANALAIHPSSGDVYAGGKTDSSDFNSVGGGAQSGKSTGNDGFVSRLSGDLKTLKQSTFIGGTGEDSVSALDVNLVSGDIVAAGVSSSASLPSVAGGFQASNAGGDDGFVARMNARLTNLAQSTFVGGAAADSIPGIATLSDGEIAVALDSASASIVGLPGVNAGSDDVLVVLFNGQLTTVNSATRLGAGASDVPAAISVHPATGDIYVTGYTTSVPFPAIAGGAQTTYAAGNEGFISRFDATPTLVQSTYFGNLGADNPSAIAIHPISGDVYTAGSTQSINLPGTTGAAKTGLSGTQDAYVSRHTFDLRNAAVAVPAAFSFPPIVDAAPGSRQTSAPATISGLGVSPQPIAIVGGNFAQFCVSSAANCSCNVRAFGSAGTNVANGQSVCVRQYAPPVSPGGTTTTLLVGGGSATFYVGTNGCTLDVDGDGSQLALTDGLLILRAMLGLTGTAVTDSALGATPSRGDWASIRSYLNGNCGGSFAP